MRGTVKQVGRSSADSHNPLSDDSPPRSRRKWDKGGYYRLREPGRHNTWSYSHLPSKWKPRKGERGGGGKVER